MEGYVPWSRVLIFDAGFGGASMAMALGKLRIGVIIGIKQAHALFPKNEIESQMKDVPSGVWVILESVVDGVDLLAIGYKYNRRKFLFFCCTKGAGPTIPGDNRQLYNIITNNDKVSNKDSNKDKKIIKIIKYF